MTVHLVETGPPSGTPSIREICRHYPDAAPTPEDVLQEIPWRIDQREM
ncbi:hypothetical protein ABZZ37_13875 [Streptomyces sp. NPDC006464]